MKLRSTCPEAMLIKHQNNLEKSLIEVLDRYNIQLEKDKFLTICGKCGGNIITCEGDVYYELVKKKREIIENRVIYSNQNQRDVDNNNNNNKDNNDKDNQQSDQQETKPEPIIDKIDQNQDFIEKDQKNKRQSVVDLGTKCEGDGEDVHWVPQDRQIFMCEKCDQVSKSIKLIILIHILSIILALLVE